MWETSVPSSQFCYKSNTAEKESVGKNPPPHLSQPQSTCQTWPFLALILLEASEKYTFSTVSMLINQ